MSAPYPGVNFMELEAAKMIGAGIATFALFGVGLGIGNIFSTLIATVGRNPSVQQRVFPYAIIGFALVEAVALFALLIAFLILFT
jgi:F0F1-type ATP synthase membrane subunit c/vacuolar-type H+-ATPase subunit K